jgi:hypothetical protein
MAYKISTKMETRTPNHKNLSYLSTKHNSHSEDILLSSEAHIENQNPPESLMKKFTKFLLDTMKSSQGFRVFYISSKASTAETTSLTTTNNIANKLPCRGTMQMGIYFYSAADNKNDRTNSTTITKHKMSNAEKNRDTLSFNERSVDDNDEPFDGTDKKKTSAINESYLMEEILSDLQKALKKYKEINAALPEKITMDLFAFSRGVRTAQYFMDVIETHAFRFDTPYGQFDRENIEFRLVEMADDTVGRSHHH